MDSSRIAIVGFGKIARDQHVPAILANPAFHLVAAVAPHGAPDQDVAIYSDHREMLRACAPDVVAICTPAGPRHGIARDCLEAGCDVLLEKPPTTTLGEIADIERQAARGGRVLFTAWHAQHNLPVVRLAELLNREGVGSLSVEWLEDVEKWHPGQDWIWQPGGFGVFDAGINALSILVAIVPAVLLVEQARFVLHGAGRQPIAADLTLAAAGTEASIAVRLDWRHTGEEHWTISGVTAAGTPFELSRGGASLRIGTDAEVASDAAEYVGVYARFAELIAARRPSVGSEPLRLLADAFLIAESRGATAA